MKDYTHFFLNQYNNKEKPNLFAMHFKRLDAYNKAWDLSKILLYELMLVMSRKTGNKEKGFYKQQHKICEDTRLGKYTVRKAIQSLEDDGILRIDKSQGGKYMYHVEYEFIKDNLELVYNFDDTPEGEIEPLKDLINVFIDYHATTDYYYNVPLAYKITSDDELIDRPHNTPIVDISEEYDDSDQDEDSDQDDDLDEMDDRSDEEK